MVVFTKLVEGVFSEGAGSVECLPALKSTRETSRAIRIGVVAANFGKEA